MFFFGFGGAWLGSYAVQVAGKAPLVLAAIALATVILLVAAWRRFRQHQPALTAETPSPQRTRAGRIFNIVNIGQWLAILIAVTVLVNLGLSAWVIPCIIVIVGLHFLPLARVFGNPPHYVTGAALIVLAVTYPLLAPGGPASPVGCLGAGLILWASALWAIRAGDSAVLSAPRAATPHSSPARGE
jgi:hypothetical protein